MANTITSYQSNLSFVVRGVLTTSWSSVAISNDIERDQVITASNASVVLKTTDGKTRERMKVNMAWGTMTIIKRGLDQSANEVEVTALKKERRPGAIGYITIFASQAIDLDASGYSQDKYVATVDVADNTTTGNNTHNGIETITWNNARLDCSWAKLGFSVPNLTEVERLSLTPENGELVYDTTNWLLYQYSWWSWGTVDNGTPTPNASETVAGKVEIATSSEYESWYDIWDTWAYIMPKVSDIKESFLLASVPGAVWTTEYIAWESLIAWNSIFMEDQTNFASATSTGNIWDVTWNTRRSIKQVWSWTASNSFKMSLKKVSSPSVDLKIRIETDNAWSPSWTLVDANATATVTAWSLTTSLADTTITLAWSVTIQKWTVVHIVMLQWVYWSETVNWTNYYQFWYTAEETTTRLYKSYNWTTWWSQYKYDDFSTIDSTYWDTAWWISSTLWKLYITWISWQENSIFDNKIVSKSTYTNDCSLQWDLDTSIWTAFAEWKKNLLVIRYDNSNYISLCKAHYYNWSVSQYTMVWNIVVWWVEVYTTWNSNVDNPTTSSTMKAKIDYVKSTNTIKFYYWNWSSWTQIWTTQTQAFAWSYKVVNTLRTYWSWFYWFSNIAITDNLYFTSETWYSTIYPSSPSNTFFAYVNWSMFESRLATKTDADLSYKKTFHWFVKFNTSIGNYVYTETLWLSDLFTWLTPWSKYFLSWTAWSITTTPWTYPVCVWEAVLSDKLYINDFYNILLLTASSNLKASSDAEYIWYSHSSYAIAKQIRLVGKDKYGTITVSFDIKAFSLWTTYWRIYINWTAVWTERSTASSTYQTYTENFTVNNWDYIQLYIYNAAQTPYCRNMRLYRDEYKWYNVWYL